MLAVTIKKTNKKTGKESITTYTGKDEQDCLNQAHQHPWKKDITLSDDDYLFEITESTERRGLTRLERFQDRYGYKPAFGDYEATGWMER